jgi:hypothetical protein
VLQPRNGVVLQAIERARLLVWKVSLPNVVIWATAAALAGGVVSVVWLATGQAEGLPLFIRYPGTLTVIALNLAGLGLSVAAQRQFSRGEPLRLVWSALALAAACNLTSGAFSQVAGESWRRARLILGGPLQTVLLVLGLALALRIYRRSGIRSRPRIPDWLLMGVVAGFGGWEIYESLLQAPGSPVSFQQAVSLVNDPLLSLLLIEAILIRRSALKMGRGLIARCWGAFTAGIFLTFVGDIAVWISGHSPLPVPLTATTWYLWFLASAAYALAPACQVEACRRAGGSLPAPLSGRSAIPAA